MRFWHKSFISVLPRKQLIAQLREYVIIAGKIHEPRFSQQIEWNKVETIVKND